jgi:TonB family protein
MIVMNLSLTIFGRLVFAAILLSSISAAVDAQAKRTPIKQVTAGIVNGKARTLPKPEYPKDARKAKLSGTVKVQVLIDEAGRVISAKAISGLENVELRIAAETAARRATFSPTLLNGQPVKVSGTIVYNFIAERSNEEKLKVLGVATFLTIARSFASDLHKLKDILDDDVLFTDEIGEFGEFAPELKALASIEKLPVAKRLEAVDTALSSVRSKLNESDQWQFEVGKSFGELLGSLMWSASGADDFSKLYSPGLKLNLNKIRDLTLSAPADCPQSVLAKLKDVTAMGDKEDLSTSENMKEFFEKLEALFEVISPGSTK